MVSYFAILSVLDNSDSIKSFFVENLNSRVSFQYNALKKSVKIINGYV